MSRARRVAALAAVAAILAGCSGAPILANPPISFPSPPVGSPAPSTAADPIPIVFPRDDGPHDRLTEWWYYTGHLQTQDGRTFGFEAVVFRAERGSVPVAWASHLAITDEGGNAFYYAQRSEIGPQVDHSPRGPDGAPDGFDLDVSGLSPALIAAGAPAQAAPWHLAGSNGSDRIVADLAPEETTAAGAAFGLNLTLHALKAPALHQGIGFIDFGAAGSSYYYSRTRLSATGMLTLNGEPLHVTGIAWFDHQWGDFVSVGAGGWDWFAINLDDGTDITISTVLDENAVTVLQYGTLVRPTGEVVALDTSADLSVGASGFGWESPQTRVVYPNSWTIFLTRPGLDPGLESANSQAVINLNPTVADQELDTRATTGVAYWEGSEIVTTLPDAAQGGEAPQIGRAYVEITRYDLPGG